MLNVISYQYHHYILTDTLNIKMVYQFHNYTLLILFSTLLISGILCFIQLKFQYVNSYIWRFLLLYCCIGFGLALLRKITFMANEDQKKPLGMILLSAAPYGDPKAANISSIAK